MKGALFIYFSRKIYLKKGQEYMLICSMQSAFMSSFELLLYHSTAFIMPFSRLNLGLHPSFLLALELSRHSIFVSCIFSSGLLMSFHDPLPHWLITVSTTFDTFAIESASGPKFQASAYSFLPSRSIFPTRRYP